MTGSKFLPILLTAAVMAAAGCGAKEDPDVSKPVDRSAVAAPAPSNVPIKPDGSQIDPSQKAQVDAEQRP
ncbi:hypothetical protein [Fimbriimonas ginsengisoli]|uniref:Lipoprotein n=1 Tax=Fimbriimonas ginsengisoli Gsoil 348 TaxID=661478 RepID=A0A068NX67_FIMGI|nr:hypothetical protein [Fimbriimonas ginsengisoli]AIE87380.1 hypothetical protein OP10G_4012 [Fimbriimonas ginsengisoli Gsoil 348]